MATFGVHLAVGLATSGLAAASVLAAQLASPSQMLAYMGLGTLGSLLPDLDADNSAPIRIGFTVAAIACAFAAMFLLSERFGSVAEMATVWLLGYLLLRWLIFALFTRLTVHRGIFHSLPAALLSGLLTAVAAFHPGGQAPFQAWLAGLFVSFGYLVHLVLDELYAVNLFGLHTRRSLGTALKLWFPGSHAASLYMYLACAAALPATPDPDPFLRVVTSAATYQRIGERLLPVGGWFRLTPVVAPRTAERSHPAG